MIVCSFLRKFILISLLGEINGLCFDKYYVYLHAENSKKKEKVKKIFYILGCLALMTTIISSCGKKDKAELEEVASSSADYVAKGDSLIYGLACDGCTDSVVVFLPEDCSDPVTYNVLAARRRHQVYGKLEIGDRIAILVDSKDKNVANLVIDIDKLAGTWTYKVMPTLRVSGSQDGKSVSLPDSVLKTYMIAEDYGFTLTRQMTARSIGHRQQQNLLEDESPVEYPKVTRYGQWHVWNGKLILTRSNRVMGNATEAKASKQPVVNDTADILYFMEDSLALRFGDEIRGYHKGEVTGK